MELKLTPEEVGKIVLAWANSKHQRNTKLSTDGQTAWKRPTTKCQGRSLS